MAVGVQRSPANLSPPDAANDRRSGALIETEQQREHEQQRQQQREHEQQRKQQWRLLVRVYVAGGLHLERRAGRISGA